MKTPIDNDLNEAYEAFNQDHDHLRKTLLASLPNRSKAHKRMSKIVHIRAFFGDTIMRNRITKIAAAAVIIIAVMLGINYMGGSPDGASVAWGDVLENIEAARTVMYIFEIESGDVKELFKIRIKEPYLSRSDVIESPYKYKVAIRNARTNKRMILFPNTTMAVIYND